MVDARLIVNESAVELSPNWLWRRSDHRSAWQADVDDPLKNDDVFDVRLIERVMIEASQAVDA